MKKSAMHLIKKDLLHVTFIFVFHIHRQLFVHFKCCKIGAFSFNILTPIFHWFLVGSFPVTRKVVVVVRTVAVVIGIVIVVVVMEQLLLSSVRLLLLTRALVPVSSRSNIIVVVSSPFVVLIGTVAVVVPIQLVVVVFLVLCCSCPWSSCRSCHVWPCLRWSCFGCRASCWLGHSMV